MSRSWTIEVNYELFYGTVFWPNVATTICKYRKQLAGTKVCDASINNTVNEQNK